MSNDQIQPSALGKLADRTAALERRVAELERPRLLRSVLLLLILLLAPALHVATALYLLGLLRPFAG